MLNPKAQGEYDHLIDDIDNQWQIDLHTDHRPSVDILRPSGRQSFHMDVLRLLSTLAHQFPTQRDTTLLLLQQNMQWRAANPRKGVRSEQRLFPGDIRAVRPQLQAIMAGGPVPAVAPVLPTVPPAPPAPLPAQAVSAPVQPAIALPAASLQASLGTLQIDPALLALPRPEATTSESDTTSRRPPHTSLDDATSIFEASVREACASTLRRFQGQEGLQTRLESHIKAIHSVVRAVVNDLENTIATAEGAPSLSQPRSTQPLTIESSSQDIRPRVETSAAASNPVADDPPEASRREPRALIEVVDSSESLENSDWILWDFEGVSESVLDRELGDIEESSAVAAKSDHQDHEARLETLSFTVLHGRGGSKKVQCRKFVSTLCGQRVLNASKGW